MAGQQGQLAVSAGRAYRIFPGAGFPGNPTTVQDLRAPLAADALLAHSRGLATEDNAYLLAMEPGRYRAWFYSHYAELRICGHALLAVAHDVARRGAADDCVLETPWHRHACRRLAGEIAVSLPVLAPRRLSAHPLAGMLAAAGVPVQALLGFPNGVLAGVTASARAVRDFNREAFDWRALAPLRPGAVILTCAMEGGYGLRYFAPWHGKPEDSATGSAQCYLAAWWLGPEASARVTQLSPAGPAHMMVRREGERLWLSGAVTAGTD